MKFVITVLLAVTAISLLVFAAKTFSDVGEPPDRLYTTCVDQSDQMMFRMQRDTCDRTATDLGYSVGIFRPEKPLEPIGLCLNEIEKTPYVCLGAPHQEVEMCPGGSLPPCD